MANDRPGRLAESPEIIPLAQLVWLPAGTGPYTETQPNVLRRERNLWELVLDGPGEAPSLRLQLELDVCGAWLTILSARPRPVVVRRAGWTDLRGQPPGLSEEIGDRVGLGPGDAIVSTVGASVEPELMRGLLDCASAEPEQIAAYVEDVAGTSAGVLVLKVPALDRDLLLAELIAATGLPAEGFQQPLHPVGSPEAELWDARPAPPREARLRVPPDIDAVPRTRGLLRRLMASWRMEELLDEGPLELLATELVTNAVIHAGTEIDVVTSYDGAEVRFEVHDRDRSIPELIEPDLEAEGGRGVWLVSELSEAWGAEPSPSGKRIWFTVAS